MRGEGTAREMRLGHRGIPVRGAVSLRARMEKLYFQGNELN